MFHTLKTLVQGANAAAEEQLRDTYAIPLINQRIRETEEALRAAKNTLASLMQRHRSEANLRKKLQEQIDDLITRAQAALEANEDTLAQQAATAIAQLENEAAMRDQTLARLDEKITNLRGSVESGHRRLIDLKQGAIAARAVRREQQIQSKFRKNQAGANAIEDAAALINNVLNQDDPFEYAQILSGIDEALSHSNLADRMADQGFGATTRSTPNQVMARLKASATK